jgi:hypothetical protein
MIRPGGLIIAGGQQVVIGLHAGRLRPCHITSLSTWHDSTAVDAAERCVNEHLIVAK